VTRVHRARFKRHRRAYSAHTAHLWSPSIS